MRTSSKGQARTQPKLGLIVEGDTEFKTFPAMHGIDSRWPPIKPVNLGGVGSHKLPVGIAKQIAPKIIQLHAAGVDRVVVCIDREQRRDCVVTFADAVRQELGKELAAKQQPGAQFAVVVADRAFEAWILAGADSLYSSKLFKNLPVATCFEGQLGAQDKKGVVEIGKCLGKPYDKLRDGPKLFQTLDHKAAADDGPGKRGSRSLRKLHKELGVIL